MNITFVPLTELHFPLLLNWLESTHVKERWDQDIVYTLELVKEKFGEHAHAFLISNKQDKLTYAYIIKVDDEAIGYIQAYNAKAHAEDNDIDISFIEGQVCGIDLFIGNKQFLHKGLGAIIIEEFCRQLLAEHFAKCLIDPESNNEIAIRSFQKAGFKAVPQLQTENITWMIKELDNLSSNRKINEQR
jgi:RimJ/RimL family protein N-acetyltransferase